MAKREEDMTVPELLAKGFADIRSRFDRIEAQQAKLGAKLELVSQEVRRVSDMAELLAKIAGAVNVTGYAGR